MKRYDPPMTDAERRRSFIRSLTGSSSTGTKRQRKRGTLTREAKRAKDCVYRAVRAGRLVTGLKAAISADAHCAAITPVLVFPEVIHARK